MPYVLFDHQNGLASGKSREVIRRQSLLLSCYLSMITRVPGLNDLSRKSPIQLKASSIIDRIRERVSHVTVR